MLFAHLVPGYFAAAHAARRRDRGPAGRRLLWAAVLRGTVAPDLDVIYNVLSHSVFHHTTLWTHSLLVYIPLAAGWWLLARMRRWPYLTTLAAPALLGGASHLFLDVASHGTPLLYPFTLTMFG